MASRMVYSSIGSVCGFAGAELPISVYPGGYTDRDQLSVNWSLSLEAAEQLAAELLAAIQAVRSAPPVEPCERCGSTTGVQFSADGPNKGCCTMCMSSTEARS